MGAREWVLSMVGSAVVGGLIAAAVVLLIGAPVIQAAPNEQAVSSVVRTRELILVGPQDTKRAELFVNDNGAAVLTLWDQDGRRSVQLHAHRERTTMRLSSPDRAEPSILMTAGRALGAPGRDATIFVNSGDARVDISASTDTTQPGSFGSVWVRYPNPQRGDGGSFLLLDSTQMPDGPAVVWRVP
jgi:hypothetical protein